MKWLVVGLLATKVILERRRLERLKGNKIEEPIAIELMLKVNRYLYILDSVSFVLNTVSFLALSTLGHVLSLYKFCRSFAFDRTHVSTTVP